MADLQNARQASESSSKNTPSSERNRGSVLEGPLNGSNETDSTAAVHTGSDITHNLTPQAAAEAESCVIYVRSATADDQAFQNQLEQCLQFAASNGYEILAVFQDVSSGSTLKRPGMTAVVSYLRRRRARLIVRDFGRLTRRADCANKLVQILRKTGTVVTTVQ